MLSRTNLDNQVFHKSRKHQKNDRINSEIKLDPFAISY
ncbi:hypothetical protein X278_04870 [Oenococcus oeni IOEB_0205]|nr:hypothetical protein X278_04870 [Oenococcus oeni IOEB_0205]